MDWWRFVGILVHDYHIPPSEAWNCTLREFCIITRCRDKKAIREQDSKATQEEIMDFFAMRELING
jgi:hypothetical protein|tara:strand:+ start:1007 stop:1204 length:198 start_codon:yes stop_codon:yes gene_type:complete